MVISYRPVTIVRTLTRHSHTLQNKCMKRTINRMKDSTFKRPYIIRYYMSSESKVKDNYIFGLVHNKNIVKDTSFISADTDQQPNIGHHISINKAIILNWKVKEENTCSIFTWKYYHSSTLNMAFARENPLKRLTQYLSFGHCQNSLAGKSSQFTSG